MALELGSRAAEEAAEDEAADHKVLRERHSLLVVVVHSESGVLAEQALGVHIPNCC